MTTTEVNTSPVTLTCPQCGRAQRAAWWWKGKLDAIPKVKQCCSTECQKKFKREEAKAKKKAK
jgi:hypothetical protein